jgi:hypothetical protein
MNSTTLRKAALLVALTVTASLGLWAQATTPPSQTFGTTIYLDYSFNLTNNGYLTGTDAAKALDNKFAFRRAYFTYENKISDYLKFRFRLDADNTANITSVDFGKSSTKKDDKLRPFMKHLYLEWSQDWLQSKFNIGMIETLSFKLAEDRWGMRSVAKTLLDGYKDITGVDIHQSSADIGVTWKGTLAKELRFALGVHNGPGYSHAETDKYKKFSGYLQFIPTAGFNVIGYIDYEKQPVTGGTPKDAWTYKVDGYFDMVDNLNISAEWFIYKNDTYINADKSHDNVSGYSVFGTYKITPEKFALFARFDHYQPNSTDSNKDMNLVILGFDWYAWGNFARLQPNVWFYSYKDSAKKGDFVANVTFFLSF